MSQKPAVHNTFDLTRKFSLPVERIFEALSQPAAKRKWFAEGENHEVLQFDMDFRVGGTERTVSRFNEKMPFPGAVFTNNAVYLEITHGTRIVTAATMSFNQNCISASLATFELFPDGTGTELVFTHQAAYFEGSDTPEMRRGGWEKLLGKLEIELV